MPVTNTKHGSFSKSVQDHKNQQQKVRNQINQRIEELSGEIVQEYLDRRPYNSTVGGFAKFPTPEAVKQLQG
jgi:hypothetical protein